MISTTELRWSWQGTEVTVGLDVGGTGPVILLLPALSSISTKDEMRPLMERLISRFRVVAVDWPGFGTRPRPAIRWRPDALSAFLDHVLTATECPHGIVAAGHAATYVLNALGTRHTAGRIALIAPTWRGPLPTMAGGYPSFLGTICHAVETPVIGPFLYRLNVNSFVVGKMVSGHVYSQRGWLSGERLAAKRQVISASGARFASAAFVTGSLDRVRSREAFLTLAARAAAPLLVVYGAETPKRSCAEIEALAQLPGIRIARLEQGKLAVHEEFPDQTAAAILPFFLEGAS